MKFLMWSSLIGPDSGATTASRLGRALTWNVIGALCASASNFVLMLIAARMLGREQFGEYGMIQSTALTVSGVAQLAIGYTATRYVAEFRASDKERAGRVIGLCSAVGIVTAAIATATLVVAAGWIATETLKAPQLTTGLILSSALVCFATMGGYQTGVLAGLESYDALARGLMLSSVLNLAVAVTGAIAFGLLGLLAGAGVGSALQWLIFRRLVVARCRENGIRISYDGMFRERAIVFRFALPASIGGLIAMPAVWLANACLARQPAGFSELGLYSAAMSVRSLVLFLPLLLNQVTMSFLNHERGRQRAGSYRRIFYYNLGITAGLLLASVAVVSVIGPWVLALFGRSFSAGYAVTVIVIIGTAFDGIMQAPYQLIQTHERMWLSVAFVTVPRDVSRVVLASMLAPTMGAIGLAIASAIASAIALCTTVVLASAIGFQTPAPKLACA
ncbi:MAG TPA: oligosaccharide flippase family protein [Vicinamibacterales bacterium]|nr:oligosaccharide flippase family protein [Vicinamibacterales bacterium]